ncbi:MAG: membrane protein insertion efficiency factor YidD [Ruminococcaceae bacterium]|nr:membrane protein insertion efficiency factor YidD [Oscillospiraceae bacterium]
MKHICIALIRFYRKFLSPLKSKPCCRFTPTCSAYALEAFQKRGFFVGIVLTVTRIFRCNPFCAGGYDPVPIKGFRNPKDETSKNFDGDMGENKEFVFEYDLALKAPIEKSKKKKQNERTNS